MNRAERIPDDLMTTQQWFAGVITRRLGDKERINPISPGGGLIAEEAARYIVPTDRMRPHQRIQIYNQQYWWRLLNTMHINFPLLTRLFGYQAFNEEIAIPFLLDFPPSTWMLSHIGEQLPGWLKQNYKKSDLPLIQNAALLDWAFTASSIAPQKMQLDLSSLQQGGDPARFLTETFFLQPHVRLFSWEYNLIAFREQFMREDVDYWTKNRFPKLAKIKSHFVIYRNSSNTISYKGISEAEHYLLSFFKEGISLEKAFVRVEENERIYNEVATHLQEWIPIWTQAGILTTG